MSEEQTLMNTEKLENELCTMCDDALYEVVQRVLSVRKVEYYKESADDLGWPTSTAKLAVMKQICCG